MENHSTIFYKWNEIRRPLAKGERAQKFWAMGSSQVAIWWFRERVAKSDFRVHDWLDITVVCRSFGNRFAIGTARMLFLKAACNGYQSFVFWRFQRSHARPKHVFHGFCLVACGLSSLTLRKGLPCLRQLFLFVLSSFQKQRFGIFLAAVSHG